MDLLVNDDAAGLADDCQTTSAQPSTPSAGLSGADAEGRGPPDTSQPVEEAVTSTGAAAVDESLNDLPLEPAVQARAQVHEPSDTPLAEP